MGVLSKFSSDASDDKAKQEEAKPLQLKLPAGQSAGECLICTNPISNRAVLDPCGHAFDLDCLNELFKTKDECPRCLTVNKKILFNIISESEYETSLTEIPHTLQFKDIRYTCSANITRSARMCMKIGKPGFYLAAVRSNRIQLVKDSPKKPMAVVDIEPDSPLFLETLDHPDQYIIDCGTKRVMYLSTCHKIMQEAKKFSIKKVGKKMLNSLTAKLEGRESPLNSDEE